MSASYFQKEIHDPSFEIHDTIRVHLEAIEKCLERLPLRTSQILDIDSLRTEKELSRDILEITMAIEEQYPELSKYLEEFPAEVSDVDLEVNRDSLACYYHTLDALLTGYARYHP
jgi:hypothetical protein